eukprot:Gb_00401 [translate_table: standard]
MESTIKVAPVPFFLSSGCHNGFPKDTINSYTAPVGKELQACFVTIRTLGSHYVGRYAFANMALHEFSSVGASQNVLEENVPFSTASPLFVCSRKLAEALKYDGGYSCDTLEIMKCFGLATLSLCAAGRSKRGLQALKIFFGLECSSSAADEQTNEEKLTPLVDVKECLQNKIKDMNVPSYSKLIMQEAKDTFEALLRILRKPTDLLIQLEVPTEPNTTPSESGQSITPTQLPPYLSIVVSKANWKDSATVPAAPDRVVWEISEGQGALGKRTACREDDDEDEAPNKRPRHNTEPHEDESNDGDKNSTSDSNATVSVQHGANSPGIVQYSPMEADPSVAYFPPRPDTLPPGLAPTTNAPQTPPYFEKNVQTLLNPSPSRSPSNEPGPTSSTLVYSANPRPNIPPPTRPPHFPSRGAVSAGYAPSPGFHQAVQMRMNFQPSRVTPSTFPGSRQAPNMPMHNQSSNTAVAAPLPSGPGPSTFHGAQQVPSMHPIPSSTAAPPIRPPLPFNRPPLPSNCPPRVFQPQLNMQNSPSNQQFRAAPHSMNQLRRPPPPLTPYSHPLHQRPQTQQQPNIQQTQQVQHYTQPPMPRHQQPQQHQFNIHHQQPPPPQHQNLQLQPQQNPQTQQQQHSYPNQPHPHPQMVEQRMQQCRQVLAQEIRRSQQVQQNQNIPQQQQKNPPHVPSQNEQTHLQSQNAGHQNIQPPQQQQNQLQQPQQSNRRAIQVLQEALQAIAENDDERIRKLQEDNPELSWRIEVQFCFWFRR